MPKNTMEIDFEEAIDIQNAESYIYASNTYKPYAYPDNSHIQEEVIIKYLNGNKIQHFKSYYDL